MSTPSSERVTRSQPAASPPPPSPSTGPSYYTSLPLSIGRLFEDLDRDDVYRKCADALMHPELLNFIVDFGGPRKEQGRAFCALNVESSEADITELLKTQRPAELRTRWINISSPHLQKPLLTAITNHYGFSPRLFNVILAAPSSEPPPSRAASMASRRSGVFHRRSSGRRDVETGVVDATSLQVPNGVELHELDKIRKIKGGKMNHMDLVRNVWHWHAVEWGGKFTCIGFNHLHRLARNESKREGQHSSGESDSEFTDDDDEEREEEKVPYEFDAGEYDPVGKRLWSWLILCEDGTVLSINEPVGNISREQLLNVRRNTFTVFRSLSQSSAAISAEEKESGMMLGGGLDDLPFRRKSERGDNVEGGPSLLLYYLFDDWHASYEFVLGRGAPYSQEMRTLRNEMRKKPQWRHLSVLHKLARQLAMLKRMFETRQIILENILYRQENSINHPKAGSPRTNSMPAHPKGFVPPDGNPDILGVPLHPLAVAKFERLRDRIKLYLVGELSALLQEKSELETLTFNLISLKQSTSVEQLTKVTIWLTKFTFLFFPLTLVTGYFSMQLKDINNVYTQKTFWGSAGVSVILTGLVLYTVGKSTNTMDLHNALVGIRDVWFGWVDWGSRKKKQRRKRRARREEAKQAKLNGS